MSFQTNGRLQTLAIGGENDLRSQERRDFPAIRNREQRNVNKGVGETGRVLVAEIRAALKAE